MWHVLDAAPEARIALGFREPVTPDQVRAAALDGSIEQLLQWRRAAPGDTFFTPAGTVHALDAGLVVLEIQQVSDVTYRLWDYRRGRPLHLDQALDVADLGPHPGKCTPQPLAEGGLLLSRCPYFATESWCLTGSRRFPADSMLIPLEGSALLDGVPVAPGQVWQLDSEAELQPQGHVRLVCTYVPPA
jgi:mannose-6-phosphate isomerase